MFLTACILPSVHIIQRLLPRESRRRGNETQDNAENHGAAAEHLSRGSCEVLVDMEYCYGRGNININNTITIHGT